MVTINKRNTITYGSENTIFFEELEDGNFPTYRRTDLFYNKVNDQE